MSQTSPETKTLKPCPFCGGEPQRYDIDCNDPLDANGGGSGIECKRCHATTALHFERKNNLFSSWNDRAAPVSAGANDLLERLRNPMWVHSNIPLESPQLEQKENLAAMLEAADEIEQSRSHAPTAQQWRPIETAPKDGTRILLFQSGRGAFEGWWHTDWPRAEAYWMDDADSEPCPSHWQPCLAFPTVFSPAVSSTDRTPAKAAPWPAKGDRMIFLNENGYPEQRKRAAKVFEVGKEYEVDACNVGDWSHSVRFVGVEGWHNGVMFQRVSVTPPDPKHSLDLGEDGMAQHREKVRR